MKGVGSGELGSTTSRPYTGGAVQDISQIVRTEFHIADRAANNMAVVSAGDRDATIGEIAHSLNSVNTSFARRNGSGGSGGRRRMGKDSPPIFNRLTAPELYTGTARLVADERRAAATAAAARPAGEGMSGLGGNQNLDSNVAEQFEQGLRPESWDRD
eukprot:COSAG05_NODE_541_length_8832_cov_190.458491_7_plen_158_part_00